METVRLPRIVRFGVFELDPARGTGELHQDGRTLRLQEQPFQVLRVLIEHSGEVVTRQEIKKKLGPNDTIVEFDHSINAAIKKLRLALGGLGGRAAVCGDRGAPRLPPDGAGGIGWSRNERGLVF